MRSLKDTLSHVDTADFDIVLPSTLPAPRLEGLAGSQESGAITELMASEPTITQPCSDCGGCGGGGYCCSHPTY
jgi:hypothetical protein